MPNLFGLAVLTSDVELGFGEGAAGRALCFTDVLAFVVAGYAFNDERAVRHQRETTVVFSQKQLRSTPTEDVIR